MDEQTNMIKTGIEGLDDLIGGGIPFANQVVLAGGPGAGKTLLSFEILYRNAKAGNKGIYFSLEESEGKLVSNLKSTFSQFVDVDDLIKKKIIIVEGRQISAELSNRPSETEHEFGNIVSQMESMIFKESAKLIVVDSSAILSLLVQTPLMYRRLMLALSSNFRRLGVTTILIVESNNLERSKVEFKPEYFIFDGIIMMYQNGKQEKRTTGIEVIKMRGAKHSFYTAPYEITSSGIKISPITDQI